MRRLAAILIILLFALPAWAGHRHLEKEYQANGAIAEAEKLRFIFSIRPGWTV
ncbi:MAG: hypothetical protein M0R06_22410 [Sphaerochaeta sp.]|jgi:hypothetical protein|nr:hypothetical protein [Sphaerochaeta sp.]